MTDELIIAGKAYSSRLLVGTGKYKDFAQTRQAIDASGAKIVTVAIRRTNIGQNADEPSLLEFLPAEEFTYLPNTAGCYSADDAVRTLRLARDPILMASAMKKAVEAGREAFLAGRMAKKLYSASPSSPTTGMIERA